MVTAAWMPSRSVVGLAVKASCQGGVATRDQALPGVVRVGDLGEVGLVEQAHLQRSVVGGQGGYCGGA